MGHGRAGGGHVLIFQVGLSFILTGFHVDWEVDFCNFAVEAKDRLEVGLDDVARKIGDDDDLGI